MEGMSAGSTASTSATSTGSSAGRTASPSPSPTSSPSQTNSSVSAQGSPSTQPSGYGGQPNQQTPSAQTPTQGENQTQREQQAAEARRLGEADLDALVTVKINGESQDLPLREVIKLQQLERASHEKMRQAAEMQRRIQEQQRQLMELDLDRFAEMKQLDLDAISEERLARKFDEMQMTPEQRELNRLRQAEQQRIQQETQYKQAMIEDIKQFTNGDLPPGIENATPQQIEHFRNYVREQSRMIEANLERDFINGLQTAGLPKSKFLASRVAYAMMNSKNSDGTPLQADQAALKVKQEFGSDAKEMLGTMDAKAILEFLGEDIVNKIRQYDVERVTAHEAASAMPKNQSPGEPPASSTGKKQLGVLAWREAMGLV